MTMRNTQGLAPANPGVSWRCERSSKKTGKLVFLLTCFFDL